MSAGKTKTLETSRSRAQAGDLAQLVGPRNKNFIVRLQPGGELHTHLGVLQHDDLIGQQWGRRVRTHLGNQFLLLQPALDDLLRDVRRRTQILYPKDIGYLLVTMGILPGVHVLEAGTGSGALTVALASAVGPQGHVTTYERRPEMQRLAQSNLERLGLTDRVTFKLRDMAEGFDERDAHALFLDLPNPQDYIQHAAEALMPGGFFGCILPTTNQVVALLEALEENDFSFIEVSEILHRYYKPVAERLRPTDRMTAHTGFLIFARRVSPQREEAESDESPPASDADTPER